MVDQQKMRASDRDRQQVVERLRSALEDGRLTMEQYVDRMEVAYQAATYGDLAPLCADLPASSPVVAGRETAAAVAAPPADLRPRKLPRRPADSAQGSVDHVADRRVGQRGRLGPGQRHRWSPGLPLASLGCRSVRGGAVRRVGWCHAIPAQPDRPRSPRPVNVTAETAWAPSQAASDWNGPQGAVNGLGREGR